MTLPFTLMVFAASLLFLKGAYSVQAEELRCLIGWHPKSSTMTNWNRFEASMWGTPGNPQIRHTGIGVWEFAVRSLASNGIGMRLKFQGLDPFPKGEIGNLFGGSINSYQFGKDQIKQLNDLLEGTFECAILGDGVRCSNVGQLTIDHSYSGDSDPVIRVVAIQPVAGDQVTEIGVWIVPPLNLS